MKVAKIVNAAGEIVRVLGYSVAIEIRSRHLRAAAADYAKTIPAESWLRTLTGIRALNVAKGQIHWTEARGTERFVLRGVREFLNYLTVELLER